MRIRSFACSVLAWVILLPAALFAQEPIGVVAGMQTQVIRNAQQLRVGDQIFQDDTVSTNQSGISQFQFSDRSSAKLGPNSSIQFSSDILALAGREATIAVRMISGIARFTGSDSTKTNPIIVRTPDMALGVLGGVVDVRNVGGNGQANLLSGRMVCAANGSRRFVRNPGFSCVVGADGKLRVIKTAADFAFALDSTDVPNAGNTTGANVQVRAGRFNPQNLPVHCGSDTSAQGTECQADFGGYPLPDESEPFDRVTEIGAGETNYEPLPEMDEPMMDMSEMDEPMTDMSETDDETTDSGPATVPDDESL